MSIVRYTLAVLSLAGVRASPVIGGRGVAAEGTFRVTLHRQLLPVARGSGTLSYKSVYFGNVAVGGPDKQHFSIIFDTGSGYAILPSAECRSAACQAHRRYDRRLSVWASDVNSDGRRVYPGEPREEMTLTFGTGEIIGQFAEDVFCLGNPADPVIPSGPASTNLSVFEDTALFQRNVSRAEVPQAAERQTGTGCARLFMVKANKMSDEPFSSFSFDGILGLGLETLSLVPKCSFMGELIRNGLPAPAFSIFLSRSEQEDSEMTFGGYDETKLASELVRVPVVLPEHGHWMIRVEHLRIGNRTLDFCEDGTCRAVADSGTSLIATPNAVVEEIRNELADEMADPPDVGKRSSCRGAVGPSLEFVLEGITLRLTAEDYARKSFSIEEEYGEEVAKQWEDEAEKPEQDTDEDDFVCFPAVMGIDMEAPVGPKLFIFGEPVLKKYVTVYDFAQPSVGFAEAAGSIDDEQGELVF